LGTWNLELPPFPMTFTHPHFAAPAWLWLAVLGPMAFAGLCIYAARGRAKQLKTIAEPESHARLLRSHSRLRRAAKNILIALILTAIGCTLARPQWGLQTTQTASLQGE